MKNPLVADMQNHKTAGKQTTTITEKSKMKPFDPVSQTISQTQLTASMSNGSLFAGQQRGSHDRKFNL